MEIRVSTKNEFNFYPDMSGNMDFDEDKRWTIVVRNLNSTLHGKKWTEYATGKDGEMITDVNVESYIRAHFLEMKNVPSIKVDEGKPREITLEDILNDNFEAFFDVSLKLFLFINDLKKAEGVEEKKS